MKKRLIYISTFFLLFFLFHFNAGAVSYEEMCNIGFTDGVLYNSEWNFNVKKCSSGAAKCKNKEYAWSFTNSNTYICPATGCVGDFYTDSVSGTGLNSLFSNSKYYNIFSKDNKGVSGVYTDSDLRQLLESGQCPQYAYIASSKKKRKIAFIFSSQKVNNAKELFESEGFTVEFELDGGTDLNEEYKKLYEDHLIEMKNNIKEFKENNWGTEYNEECWRSSKFGEMTLDMNLTIKTYNKYKSDLLKNDSSYNFSEGDSILKEYKSLKCATKFGNNNGDTPNYTPGEEQYGCDVIPDVVKKWINISANFVKYVALVLVIVLGTIDFIKAAGSGEPDAVKKAGQSFLKRVIAVIILFILPMLIELILDLINLYGSNNDCFK